MFVIQLSYRRAVGAHMSVITSAGAVLAQAVKQLRAGGLDDSAATAALDAQLLLAHALGTTRERLLSHPELAVEPPAARRYAELIARRAAGEPLAYLTGTRDFWSLRLTVSRAVLVPRPETELLVERALRLRAAPQGRVADLGTGSGAVALALASERPHWQLTATDVSAEALAVARANAVRLGISLELRRGSWFEPLAGRRFDLLVSNPPYVAADDPLMTRGALAHEPRLALTPGADALACLRAIVHGAPQHLAHGGWLVLEHGAEQGEQLRAQLVLAGFAYVRSYRDLAGHERVTEAQHGQI
jgi:release factor glutamine methyltransferase